MHLTRRLLALSLLCVVGGGGPVSAAHAAEPTMPLDQVKKGMRCTAKSVISGVDIATFDIEILDVVAGDSAAREPFILFRASGPAVDATGIGPGFSGSPISCPDAAGVLRVAGAISEGIGDYGNQIALATPIDLILGEPVDPPAETRIAPALVRSARPLATPLSVGGLSGPVADTVRAAARRAGRVVYAAPAAPVGPVFPAQPLQGGSAMAVGLASGDVTAGAIGTVAYVDGDKVWSFGHSLDGAGRRSLFLQDAYVYAVVDNPIGAPDLTTYKFAAPGHDVGTLTNDAASAVVGRLGALPTRFPLKVTGTDLDTGRVNVSNTQIADEGALGLPTGASALTQVGAIAISEVAYELLHGVPLRQSGSMCVSIGVVGLPKPMRFCNNYNGGSLGVGGGAALANDFGAATSEIDAYNFGPVRITGVDVDIKLRRSLRQAYLLKATAPRTVRRGKKVKVKLFAQRVNGPKLTRTISVAIPKGTPLGVRRLQLTGAASDGGASLEDALTSILDIGSLFGGDTGATDGGTGPRSLKALAKYVTGVHRYDGVTVSLPPLGAAAALDATGDPSADTPTGPEAVAQKERETYRDPELRLSGLVRATVRVTR
ncbi:MAG: hypothetical protein JWO02_99 [Solirubrobacterales bacterium]|nr:hypothetical protein [Solirubrobacterales bacterium]